MKKRFYIIFIIILLIFFLKTNFSTAQTSLEFDISFDWQTLDSYTPSFYEGKSLPGEEAEIKVLANVSINKFSEAFNPSKFYYEWRINGLMTRTYSKTGGNMLLFVLDPFTTENLINLKVFSSNKQESLLAEKTLSLYPRKVVNYIYRDLQNYLLTYSNVVNKKFTDYMVFNDEDLNLLVEPYYFSSKSNSSPNLIYSWSVNNIPVSNSLETNKMFYKIPPNVSGSLKIGINTSNSTKDLQESESHLILRVKKD